MDGIAARGALERCDAVLTGYVGGADIGDAILHAVTSVRRAKPEALYCCDPVIGDADTGVYVRPDIETFWTEGFAGGGYRDAEPVRDRAADRAGLLDPAWCQAGRATARSMLHGDGPACVGPTSLETEGTPADCIDMLTFEEGAFHLLRTPRLRLNVTALTIRSHVFLFHRMRTGARWRRWRPRVPRFMVCCGRQPRSGSREILTVAAQDEFVTPTQVFAAAVVRRCSPRRRCPLSEPLDQRHGGRWIQFFEAADHVEENVRPVTLGWSTPTVSSPSARPPDAHCRARCARGRGPRRYSRMVRPRLSP